MHTTLDILTHQVTPGPSPLPHHLLPCPPLLRQSPLHPFTMVQPLYQGGDQLDHCQVSLAVQREAEKAEKEDRGSCDEVRRRACTSSVSTCHVLAVCPYSCEPSGPVSRPVRQCALLLLQTSFEQCALLLYRLKRTVSGGTVHKGHGLGVVQGALHGLFVIDSFIFSTVLSLHTQYTLSCIHSDCNNHDHF